MTSALHSVYSMSHNTAERFARDGFIVVRGLLPPASVSFYVDRLTALAHGRERWTQPDGVNQNPDFWPLIFNENLLSSVRALLGPEIRYLPHNDLHFGFSSFSWHRDNVAREAGVGPDWDEQHEPYRIVRIGIYLQRFETSGFKLGLIRGSHRLTPGGQPQTYRGTGAFTKVLSGLSGVHLVGSDAEWIATDPGDCVIFDPRVLHTGIKSRGPKYSVFVAYGVDNSHFHHHWHYYLNFRKDLGYSALNPALAERLKAADLLASEVPADLTIEGAWIPSATYTYVARRFK
jgi:hypothetical protein